MTSIAILPVRAMTPLARCTMRPPASNRTKKRLIKTMNGGCGVWVAIANKWEGDRERKAAEIDLPSHQIGTINECRVFEPFQRLSLPSNPGSCPISLTRFRLFLHLSCPDPVHSFY